jgi:hypothetical protein
VSQKDGFIPLKKPHYVHDGAGNAYLSAEVSEDFATAKKLAKLPASFARDPAAGNSHIRSAATSAVTRPGALTAADVGHLKTLHTTLRRDLHYINGPTPLWYLRNTEASSSRLLRQPVTMAIAAMHRLSEISRYHPKTMAALLDGQRNWLISEFLLESPMQVFDALASEITGHQFLVPNVRPAA